MRAVGVAALVALAGCANLTEQQRLQLAAADLHDALQAVAPFVDDDAQAWYDAINLILSLAAEEQPEGFGWSALFNTVRDQEHLAIQALLEDGRTAEEAAAILAAVRIALRHLEAALTAPPPAAP